MKKQKSLWWLYVLIAVCLGFSGWMGLRLVDKLNAQQQSKETYQQAEEQAVQAGATIFADAAETPSPDAAIPEGEADDPSEDVFFINNEVRTITASPVPTETPFATNAAEAVQPTVTTQSSDSIAPTRYAQPTVSADAAVAQTPSVTGTLTPSPAPTETPSKFRTVSLDSAGYAVDFGYLQTISENVKGWLIQPDTVINYPVMQGKNNDFYLDHLFNGKVNKDGSLFMDSGNAEYFTDNATYIYGHHTKTDAMFSTLADYTSQSYYAAHPQMYLLTPYDDYMIDLFACRVSLVSDESSWRVKAFEGRTDFEAYVDELIAESTFQCAEDAKPEWGDRLLVLCTCTNENHGERYVVYGRMRPIVYGTEEAVSVTKKDMDAKETLTARVDLPHRKQVIVYAQNDPIWKNMRYENYSSNARRRFGEGGCGPTAVAMAVANLVPAEQLPTIFGYADSSNGYTFCECSVNRYFCNHLHAQYQVQTTDEYLRYFPVVMANFATGNNFWKEKSRSASTGAGTSIKFLKRVAFLYGLELYATYDNDEALAAVEKGSVAVLNLSSGNPLTGGGHYVVMIDADEEYVYLLDPYRKDSYADTDKKGILEQYADGVARVKRENLRSVMISSCFILTPATGE